MTVYYPTICLVNNAVYMYVLYLCVLYVGFVENN